MLAMVPVVFNSFPFIVDCTHPSPISLPHYAHTHVCTHTATVFWPMPARIFSQLISSLLSLSTPRPFLPPFLPPSVSPPRARRRWISSSLQQGYGCNEAFVFVLWVGAFSKLNWMFSLRSAPFTFELPTRPVLSPLSPSCLTTMPHIVLFNVPACCFWMHARALSSRSKSSCTWFIMCCT